MVGDFCMDMFLSTLSTLYTKPHKVDEVDEITPQQNRVHKIINHERRLTEKICFNPEMQKINSLKG